MAEVNLKVSGLNGNSPDGAPECVVSRRLYRNGESEYLMNGAVCRLRDIHELFMDTGLGSKAYSIIEQGKIGLILSSKPADRRALIEEAAGITKYKARRRQTHLKLEAAQQNLLRVNDIVHEVEKQLESLKRQAGKARRYHVLREEMQGVERIVYARRFVDLEASLAGLKERLAAEGQREQSAHVALETEEAQMEARRTALYEDEARLEEGRGRLGELTLAVDRHQGKAGYDKQQIAETDARGEEARREGEDLRGRVGPLATGLEARRGEEASLRGELLAAEEEAKAAETALLESTTHQSDAELRQEQARDAQVGLMGRIATFQNARASVSGSAERAQADLLKLAAEWDELQRERAAAREAREAAEAKRLAAEESLKSLGLERDSARARAGEAQLRALTLGREAESLQTEVSSLVGRLSIPRRDGEDALRLRRGCPGPARSTGEPRRPGGRGGRARDRQDPRACGGGLHRRPPAGGPRARRGPGPARHPVSSGVGRRARRLPAPGPGADEGRLRSPARDRGARSEGEGPLSDSFRVTGPHAERIKASLPDALVVESLEDALEVTFRQGPVPCVTLAGETARGAMIEGGRGVKGLLAPRREAREVAERHVVAEAQLQVARGRVAEESAAAQAAELRPPGRRPIPRPPGRGRPAAGPRPRRGARRPHGPRAAAPGDPSPRGPPWTTAPRAVSPARVTQGTGPWREVTSSASSRLSTTRASGTNPFRVGARHTEIVGQQALDLRIVRRDLAQEAQSAFVRPGPGQECAAARARLLEIPDAAQGLAASGTFSCRRRR